jgi:hypothetical protein
LFELEWTDSARETYRQTKADSSRQARYKAVRKAIDFLAKNPRHHSLQTHEFLSLKGPHGEKAFEAYARQKTPAAYRIFWYYGPAKGYITIFAITSHP